MLETARSYERGLWLTLAIVTALALFLSTIQIDVNGSNHAYAKDVGEIQNALPRWGLIHRSGYPLYTATGSLFVTALRWAGIEPAAGASLFSMAWGVATVGLLVVLAHELGASWPASALGALAVAVSRSIWVDSSLAEVHTLTLVFTVATLIFAVRYGRDGQRRDLLLLTLFFSQGVTHQRSVVLLAPSVVILSWPHLPVVSGSTSLSLSNPRTIWRHLGPVVGVAILAPLTYLYMPFRVWTGATWVFGSPGTWEGFWAMVLDNRADRVFRWAMSLEQWLRRGQVTLEMMTDDMWWPLLALGLVGLTLLGLKERRWREAIALALAWMANLALTLLIRRVEIGDAQLAAKLPTILLTGVGLALMVHWLRQWSRPAGALASAALLVTLIAWGWRVRPFVLSITRDPYAEAVIATAGQVAPPPVTSDSTSLSSSNPPDDRPTTLVAPWGRDYWALAYAQAYRGELPGLDLVDHNADFRAIVERGNRLLVLGKTLYLFPVSWWEERLGRLHLASAAPGVIELSPAPPVTASDVPPEVAFDLGNGLRVRSADLTWSASRRLLLTVHWEAMAPTREDYSVAVHLVARDPPQSGADVLAQADSRSPVEGWYPTGRWQEGEVVRDTYALTVPAASNPVAVRITMYQMGEDGSFVNTRWLSLPIPEHVARYINHC